MLVFVYKEVIWILKTQLLLKKLMKTIQFATVPIGSCQALYLSLSVQKLLLGFQG